MTVVRLLSRVCLTLGAAVFIVVIYAYITLPDVRPLAARNPSTTAFMELRARQAARAGRPLRHRQVWVPYARISRNLKRAVLTAEDDAFFDHEGLDVVQLRKAIQIDLQRGALVRGGSTVTQQLAKNLYLSPSRDPVRKLRELIIARRLEVALSKERIFELYLNVIEWGDGVWGAQAAARAYFGVSAASLSRAQAALLAGAIVNPRVLDPAHPSRRLLRRQRMILTRMGGTEPPSIPVRAPTAEVLPATEANAVESESPEQPADESGPPAPDAPPEAVPGNG